MNFSRTNIARVDAADTDLLETPAYDAVVQDYLNFMLRAATDPLVQAVENPDPLAPSYVSRLPEQPPAVLPDGLADTPEQIAPAPAHAVTRRRSDGKPEWATENFSCLLFQVNGLKLVAPLTELGGITELGELTPIFAQPAWFMGLSRWNGRNIRVIDTARLIMPERIAHGDTHRTQYQCVLMLDDSDWGLAIDGEAESIRLDASDVRWRNSVQSRPWLAGTVADRLCALLDVRALTAHLKEPSG